MTVRTHDPSGPRAAQPATTARPAAGPGLLESLMWASGYHLAQMIAVAFLIALLILAAFHGVPQNLVVLRQVLVEFPRGNLDWLLVAVMGSATLGALFFILPAAFWRLRPAPRERLGMHLPTRRQLLLLAGAVLPLAILSDELYRGSSFLVDQWWVVLTARWPVLAGLPGNFDTISLIQRQSSLTAYPLLLVIIGVGPAIGEEVIFRGVIGRGLVARWGVVRGILLTSALFALAHVSPAHAIATLPLAIFLHVVYYATRSIWAPIFVHFLNNALSATMMKYGLGQEVEVSVILLLSAIAYVTVIGWLLVSWRPARENVLPALRHAPSVKWSAIRSQATTSTMTPRWLLIAAGSGVLCFTCSFVLAAVSRL